MGVNEDEKLSNKRQRIPKGQSRMENPETQGAQDEDKQIHNTMCVGHHYT